MEYGQNAILSTGNFLCSAATANSTMDFSLKPVDDGVVDSPPNRTPQQPKSCSPSPLRSAHAVFSRMSPSPPDRVPQRKLYDDDDVQMSVPMVEAVLPQVALHEVVAVRSHRPPLPRQRLLSLGVRKTKTHDGVLPSRRVTPLFDAWDRKSIHLQKRQSLQEYKKKDNGYSRGPEILRAMELLKSKSHM